MARLLDAGSWLKLRAGGWLGLSWAHLNSGGRLNVGSERLLAGFDALSGVPHARPPEESADSWFEISKRLL